MDKKLAKTNVRNEILVSVDSDHNKICCLRIGSDELSNICTFLDSAIRQALVRTRRPSDECKSPPFLNICAGVSAF